MENKELEEFKKVSAKRNFYTTADSSWVFLWALILPIAVGLIFTYVFYAFVSKNLPSGSNPVEAMFDMYLWFKIVMLCLSEICFVLLFLAYNKLHRIKNSACNLHLSKTNWKTALFAMLLGVVAVVGFVTFIEGVLGNMFSAIGIKQSSMNLQNNTIGWYFVNLLILGVLPAVCEELIFRGVIFQGLRKNFSKWSSIILTAALFAIVHENIMQFVYPFILGIVLTTIMEHTGNLFYPILLHMFNNFTTITLSFLINIGAIKLTFAGMAWWVYILGIVLALATCAIFYLAYKFYLSKHQKIEVEEEGQVIAEPRAQIGKMPFVLLVGIVLGAIMIVINLL